MRISDWSSVLCSSDLAEINVDPSAVRAARDRAVAQLRVTGILLLALASLGVLFGVLLLRRSTRHTDWRTRADPEHRASEPESPTELSDLLFQIGRASGRARVCRFVLISWMAVSLKKKIRTPTSTHSTTIHT